MSPPGAPDAPNGEVVLGLGPLRFQQFLAVARREAPVRVGDWSALDAGRAWLDESVSAWRDGKARAPIYGVTTGFGSAKNVHLRPDQVEAAQVNLIRSHAVGIVCGDDQYFDEPTVRGAALLRAHTFLAGRSGVRRVVVEQLLGLLDADVCPRVPQRGSVGASGDLCPLAHFALVLIGEGEASVPDGHGGRLVVAGAEALSRAGLQPLSLSYKEGLALINGTALSTATLALAVADAENLTRTADVACALGLEALGGHSRALDAKVHQSRRQHGQQDAAAALRELTAGSRRLAATDDKQDVYSFRCAPQVHGAVRDAWAHVRSVVGSELDAITDNPLLFALPGDDDPLDQREHAENPRRFGREVEDNRAYSAGNFHGHPIALVADLLAMTMAQLGGISERRTAALVDPRASRGLPAHLAARPGFSNGFMLAQYSAASLVSETKVLAHPASVDSIPTGNGAEDHVPMSTWAARKARRVVELVGRVLAIELLVAVQANEWRALLPDPAVGAVPPAPEDGERLERELADLSAATVTGELGAGTATVYSAVRELSPRLVEDRSLAPDVETVARAILSGGLAPGAGIGGLRRCHLGSAPQPA